MWDRTSGLSSLSEKTGKSDHLQMKLHFLLSYLKTLSVGPVGVSKSQPDAQPSEQKLSDEDSCGQDRMDKEPAAAKIHFWTPYYYQKCYHYYRHHYKRSWCHESSGGVVVRALASHQWCPGLISRLCVICGLSLSILFAALRGFPRVLRFSPLLKNLHLIKFDLYYFNLQSPQLVRLNAKKTWHLIIIIIIIIIIMTITTKEVTTIGTLTEAKHVLYSSPICFSLICLRESLKQNACCTQRTSLSTLSRSWSDVSPGAFESILSSIVFTCCFFFLAGAPLSFFPLVSLPFSALSASFSFAASPFCSLESALCWKNSCHGQIRYN